MFKKEVFNMEKKIDLDIFESTWKYKLDLLGIVEYKNKGLIDENQYDIYIKSHGNLYVLKIYENEENRYYSTRQLDDDKLKNVIKYKNSEINYYGLLNKKSYYLEDYIQDYHKMHFDLKSVDGNVGLILYRSQIDILCASDLYVYLNRSLEKNLDEIINSFKNIDELEDFLEDRTDKEEDDVYDIYYE
jgi:hypothetical protein